MKTSRTILTVWSKYGNEIAKNRTPFVRPGYGIRGLDKRFNLGYRESERLLILIDRHGPNPPESFFEDGEALTKRNEPKNISKTELNIKGNDAWCSGGVATLDELLLKANVNPDDWNVTTWQARAWDANTGDGQVQTMHYVRAQLEPRLGKQLYAATHIPPPNLEPRCNKSGPVEKVILIPDTQVGYRRSRRHGQQWLEPIHDRKAMDLAWTICEQTQPDKIILLGDMLDLAEMSTKYPRPADLINTSQPAILEMAWWCRRLRETCPNSEILYVEGNHEARLERLIIEKAGSAEGLRGAGDDRAALSVARLLGLDALDIDYLGPFGADQWLWKESKTPVRIHHGGIVRSKGGQTVSAQLAKYHRSIIGGHVHRVEVAWATDHGPDGQRQRFALSPGCLCRVDGAVPGVTTRPDWQQGIGWIYRDTVNDNVFASAQTILNGTTIWEGSIQEGRDPELSIAKDIEWLELIKPEIQE